MVSKLLKLSFQWIKVDAFVGLKILSLSYEPCGHYCVRCPGEYKCKHVDAGHFQGLKNVCIFYQKTAEMKESAPTPISKENTFIALFLTIGSVLFAVVELVGLRRACPSSDVWGTAREIALLLLKESLSKYQQHSWSCTWLIWGISWHNSSQ